jgi:methionyl-tRNA synthetase
MPENKDSSFSWNDFYRTYNDILVGKVGNFLHRLFTLGKDAILKEPSEKIIEISLKHLRKAGEFIEKGQFLNYYKYFINLVMLSNKLIDKKQPWKYKNTKNFNFICSDLYLLALTLLILLYPVCPFSVKKYLKYLKIKKIIWPSNKKEILQIYNQIKNKKKPEIVFQKIKEEITENNAN